MRVLIVDDELRLVKVLRRMLEEERFTVDEAYDGVSGEELARAGCHDLIVLDVMLPRRNGIAVCRALRHEQLATPILLLTARDGPHDVVAGLDAGADDYLVKPFAFAELLARLRALARRNAAERVVHRLEAGGLVMDLPGHQVLRDDTPVELTPREFSLLEFFLRHPNQVLTRTQLLANVWRYDECLGTSAVDTYVHYLRQKVDRGRERKLLRTVRGVGYVLRA